MSTNIYKCLLNIYTLKNVQFIVPYSVGGGIFFQVND